MTMLDGFVKVFWIQTEVELAFVFPKTHHAVDPACWFDNFLDDAHFFHFW